MNLHIKLFCVLLSLLLLCSCGMIRPADTEAEAEETEGTETTSPVEEIRPRKDGETVICLDAGHGFRDVGCDTPLINGTEADVTIAVTLLLKEKLEELGARVVLTHDGKTYPSMSEICDLADGAGVGYVADKMEDNDIFSAYERGIYASAIDKNERFDLFLSLHVNSIEGHPEVSQYEIDYYKGNIYADSLAELCQSLSDVLDNKSVIHAKDRANAFIVTKAGVHPSILLEMGYATNKTDAEKMNSQQWREDFCEKVAKTVVQWVEAQ